MTSNGWCLPAVVMHRKLFLKTVSRKPERDTGRDGKELYLIFYYDAALNSLKTLNLELLARPAGTLSPVFGETLHYRSRVRTILLECSLHHVKGTVPHSQDYCHIPINILRT